MIIIDGRGAIAGRLAAYAAKQALLGKQVVIVNAEEIAISGDVLSIRKTYFQRRRMQNKADPEKSAKWPRTPYMLFKRIIRGMVPKHSARGKAALERIMGYSAVPKEYEGKAEPFRETVQKLHCKYVTLKNLKNSI